jgi:hypothetical protein
MRYWLLGLLVSACGGSSGSPSAEVTAATPDSIAPADDTRDDLTITVRYDDGDGDLGTGIAEVHDCRGDDLVTALAIPAIAPSSIEGDERITGTLELHVTTSARSPHRRPSPRSAPTSAWRSSRAPRRCSAWSSSTPPAITATAIARR